MLRIFKGFLLVILILGVCVKAYAQTDVFKPEELKLDPKDRILVLSPHPDDEVLGTGGVLQKAVAMNLPRKVVFFTLGDSNQWSFMVYRKHPVVMPKAVQKMGLIRRDEAMEAADVLGVGASNLVFLGYPDFGTLNIWYQHWNDRGPYRSLLTQVTHVPYQGALRYGAAYKGEEILKDLRSVLRDFRPTKIFVSHPSDHNGDHLSLYLYLRIALWDEHMEHSTEIYPFLIHFLSWPKPGGYHPEKLLIPPAYLQGQIAWKQFLLNDKQFEVKKLALAAHQSQFKSNPRYLMSFIRRNELFGDFPTFHLHMNKGSAIFKTKRKLDASTQLPDEFSSREKNAFVGIEWKFVRWEGNDLIISIELSKPLAEDVEASIYIYGYNQSVDFKKMPKINVRLGMLSYSLYDQNRRIEQSLVSVKRTPNSITLTVPLTLLGNPDRILTSARTYLGNVPLDTATWVAAELN